jgi:hypothetical protein
MDESKDFLAKKTHLFISLDVIAPKISIKRRMWNNVSQLTLKNA